MRLCVGRRACWMCFVTVALFSCCMALPSVALAREYSVRQVDMDASVERDGTLDVRDSRTYEFDGSFNGIYWDVPKGVYEGNDVNTRITSVEVSSGGKQTTFKEVTSGEAGTYQVSDKGTYWHLKMYWPIEDADARFTVSYEAPNLALRWADTSELYWKFVPKDDSSDDEWKNVTATVHLPVPKGEPVHAGENVKAWGHGPLDATVRFDGNDVVFQAPGVGSSEFLEGRILFPGSWLVDSKAKAEKRLDDVLAEEQKWADAANAERTKARIVAYGSVAVMGIAAVGTFVLTIIRKRAYKASHKPQFDDRYFRDIPSEDHPAVLGALYRGHDGEPDEDDFTASVMRLTDEGFAKLELVKFQKNGLFGKKKEKETYRLMETGRVESGMRGDAVAAGRDRVDRATLKFLFQTVAGHHAKQDDLMGPNGEAYVLMSYFEDVARNHPKAYKNGYDNWRSAVASTCEARKFFVDEGKTAKTSSIVLGVIDIVIAIGLGALGLVLGMSPALLIPLVILLMGSAGFCLYSASKMRGLSREAIELTAKLKALRRWFKDFTRLEEAIPQDVVLWNKLLVMATALGVAEEVISQLKVSMPALLEDPYFYSYGWYGYRSRGIPAPARSMSQNVGQAHTISTARLADTASSSGGGGGGGFSLGGGGGFSGGGRGGAF